jgi:hypothetical protein
MFTALTVPASRPTTTQTHTHVLEAFICLLLVVVTCVLRGVASLLHQDGIIPYALFLRRIPTLAKANITIVAGLPAEAVGHEVLSQRAATPCHE